MTTGSHTPGQVAQSAALSQELRVEDVDADKYKQTMMASQEEIKRVRETLLVKQEPHLSVLTKEGAKRLPLQGDYFEVGYKKGADFQLPGSRWLGKEQFRLDRDKRGFYSVTVLSFWAKVSIDGRRIKGTVDLKDGATIGAGGLKFKFSQGNM